MWEYRKGGPAMSAAPLTEAEVAAIRALLEKEGNRHSHTEG